MGWTDEEIDNLYKKASNHQSVGYNDAYWKEMEAMLDAEKPAKKRFVWWFFGSVMVAIAAGLSYYFVATNGTASQTKTRIAQTGNLPVLPVAASGTEMDKLSSEKNEDVMVAAVSGKTEKSNEVSEARNAQKMTPSAADKIQLSIPTENTTIKKAENVAIHANKTGATAQSHRNDRDVNEYIAINQEKQFITEANPEQNEEPVSENLTELPEEKQETTPSVENEATRAVDVDELLLKKKIGFYVAADAGAGTSYLRQPNNLYVQWGVKAGIDYTIKDRFRLGGGLGFRQQMLNDLTVSWSREYYSLGLISVNQSVAYDRLQFVDLNLHAHYVFRKFAVGLDVSPSYLISARAKMNQTQEENGKAVDGSMTHTTEKEYVRSDNFNAFGLDAGVSFQYQFKHQILLELGVGARVNKLLMNTNFDGERNKLPLRLELGFVKRF